MTTASLPPLVPSTFDLSPARGFLPATDPVDQLPEEPILNIRIWGGLGGSNEIHNIIFRAIFLYGLRDHRISFSS